MTIRLATADDWPAIWAVLEPVFRAGETYAIDRDIGEADARAYWLERPLACFVCVEDETLLGSYTLRANQPGPGAHVANCGYAVAPAARGRGLAQRLCAHSLAEAAERGFASMQFNLVVSTNAAALRAWERCGFAIVGTLPAAFDHPQHGRVDAHVLWRALP